MNAARPAKMPPALAAALTLLSRRALTAAELRDRLRIKGYEEADIEAALSAMLRYGYINDLALAESVRSTALRRGRGPLWIQKRLYGRGVEASLTQTVAVTEAEALQAARDLLTRRFGALQDPKDRQRAYRFLCNRGFTSNCARAAVGAAYEAD